MKTASAQQIALPEVPSLHRHHLQTESVSTPLGNVEALVPAAAPYLCEQPNAPAMLLIAGLGLDGYGLVRQLPLGALTHLHLLQLPNEGCADEDGLNYFARVVEAFIVARGLDKHPGGLILGGNSMGGAITLAVAIRARVKLRGLVLLGTYGSCRQLPLVNRLAAPLAWIVPMRLLRSLAWRFAGATGFRSITAVEAEWMANPSIRRSSAYFGRAVGALTTMELIEGLKTIALPAVIVHGTADSVLRYQCAEELHQSLSGSTLVTLNGARHSLFFTHAVEVNSIVAKFILNTTSPS